MLLCPVRYKGEVIGVLRGAYLAEEYSKVVNIDYLKNCFEQGIAEVNIDYWESFLADRQMCIRQSFIMTKDYDTDDIIVMVVSREITEQVQKQREQTQALQDALM